MFHSEGRQRFVPGSACALLAAALAIGVAAPATAELNLCEPGAGKAPNRWVILSTTHDFPPLGHLQVFVGDTGEAKAVGALRVCDGLGACTHPSRDGPTGRTLVAENSPATLVCADADGDGVAGLVTLQLDARDARSGDLVEVTVLPNGGDVDDAEPLPVTIVIEGTTYTGWSSFYRSF